MYENLIRLDLVGPALAQALGDPGWERLEASLVSGGKSNLTFELTCDAGQAVLRRPPTVAAVLDWELATLGEPLADLGLLLFYWRQAGEAKPVLTPAPSMLPGFPPRSYLAERYAKRTGADLNELPAWVALAHFKCAVIAQGIAARVQAGSMAGQEFGDISGEVDRIAADGLALLTERSWPDRP